MNTARPHISILAFADSVLGIRPYPWQARILLNFEAGHWVSAACANNTGKTSVLFPIAALYTLWTAPRARVQYITASGDQLRHQFFSYLRKYADRRAFTNWQWLEVEVRNSGSGMLWGRSTDSGGRIEGLHDELDSPAALLVDEAKSILPEIADTLERCNASYRLYASSTGPASGWFFDLMSAEDERTKRFTVSSDMCAHVKPADIEKDREELKPNVFAIKHDGKFLYDSGSSMIALEHARALQAAQKEDRPPGSVRVSSIDNTHPPGTLNERGIPFCDAENGRRLFGPIPANRNANQAAARIAPDDYVGSVRIIPGPMFAFCDFSGSEFGDWNALALFSGNIGWIEDAWRDKNTMATVGRFIGHFKRLGLAGYQIGGDQGFGGSLMDRMAEQGWHLKRVRNGDPARAKKDFFNQDAEAWSIVGKLIENKSIIIRDRDPERLERLIKQLTSRQKIYDSDGRERLEPKDKLKSRTGWSPDLADAFVGACMLGPGGRPYAANPGLWRQEVQAMEELGHNMERNRSMFYTPFVDWNRVF